MSSSRCFFDIVDIAMLTISCRYRVNIGTLSYLVYIDIAMLTISCRYCVNIGTLSSFACHTSFTSCRDRYPNIPRLHRQYRDDDDIVSISCQHPYPVIVCLAYLVYIIYIIDIAMLTILCQYRVEIDTLSYLVYIVYIVEIAMFTISYRYLVNNGTLSLFACHTSFTSFTSSTSRC